MSESNQSFKSQQDNDSNAAGNSATKNGGETVTVQGTKFTKEEVEQANKPQPNVILEKVSGPNIKLTRDNERVNERANEASDSTDTNTGGIISGAAKGANQS